VLRVFIGISVLYTVLWIGVALWGVVNTILELSRESDADEEERAMLRSLSWPTDGSR
jgi:hypothetical protein